MALLLETEDEAPAFVRLAGHPVRWRLLGELGRSDRTVNELTGLVGEPQNLVSYHLGKLRGAELVRSRRSAADGRDTYYALDLRHIFSTLASTGTALHPGLQLVPRETTVPVRGPVLGRVLFLCTGNSARSQMAEALLQARAGRRIVARSAGSKPKPLHPNAVRVMREEYGIDLAGRRSKHLSRFVDERFDVVVSLCDRLREVCPAFPGDPATVHWSMADPSAGGDDDDASYPAFQATAAEIDTRVQLLFNALAGAGPATEEDR